MLGRMPPPRPVPATPDPDLARRVIVGLGLFLFGLALNAGFALLKVPPIALIISAVGFVAMAARGGGQHVPTKPEQFRAIARAAGWPERQITVILTVLLGLALVGAAVMLAQLVERGG